MHALAAHLRGLYHRIVLDYVNVDTSHQLIIEFRSRGLVFYYRNALPGGGPRRRSMTVALLRCDTEGVIQMIRPEIDAPAPR